MPEHSIEAGSAAVPVAIAVPVPMSGFAARTAPSTGSGSPLPRASAIAINEVILVFLDLVGVDPPLANAVRARAALDGEVSVSATHTHAGPCVLHRGLGTLSPEAFEAWVQAGADAARAAHGARQQASVEWLEPVVAGVAVDRRRGVVSSDALLSAVRFVGLGGELIGVLASYPCHPTTLGPLNRELSGDYPGFLRAAVEEAWAGTCVFATGCAGDINTGHPATASYLLGAGDDGRTMEDSRRVGDRLASSVLHGAWSPMDLTLGVRWSSGDVSLEQVPLDAEPPAALVKSWQAQRGEADPGVAALLDIWIAWAQLAGSGDRGKWTGRVGRLDIGELAVFLLPGEPFLEADRSIRRRVQGKTLALAYWEDCPGYLPGAGEYGLGGYEVVDAHRYYGMPAPFAEGSLELVVDAALALGSPRAHG